jgi:hypothetical protein
VSGSSGYLLLRNFNNPGDEVCVAVTGAFCLGVTLTPDGCELDIFHTVIVFKRQVHLDGGRGVTLLMPVLILQYFATIEV